MRPVLFMAYSGDLQWRTRAGDEVAARLGEPLTKDLNAQALRTALDPQGAWIPAVLAAADTRLSEVRRHVPDAGGLVIASDQDSARAYAALLKKLTEESPTVVLSDEAGSSKKISDFAAGDKRWMVAVRMVSEGVDVPRLAVGVYATTTSTPLFFAQAVGRFVRARRARRDGVDLPAVGAVAARPRRGAGGRARPRPRPADQATRPTSSPPRTSCSPGPRPARARLEEGLPFEALGSEARFDHVLFDGATFGHEGEVHVGSDEEMDFLGIPGLLEPGQMRELLQQRQARRGVRRRPEPDTVAEVTTHEQLAVLRRELNGLVAAWHHRTGQAHGVDARRAAPGVRRSGRRGGQRRPSCAPGSTGCGSGRRPQDQLSRSARDESRRGRAGATTPRRSSTSWPASQVEHGPALAAPQSRCANSTGGPVGVGEVAVAPLGDRDQHRVEVDALVGESVLVAGTLAGRLVRLLAQDPVLDQRREPVGEHLPGDRRVSLHVVEAADAVEHLAQHHEGPALAEDRHRPADGAVVASSRPERAAYGRLLESWSRSQARST